MTLKALLWATKSWSQITESTSVYKIDVNLATSNEDDGTSKIKINIAGRLYLFVPIIISFVLKQLNKKWKIKNAQFQDFLIPFMSFERESFVPLLKRAVSPNPLRYKWK